MECRRRIALWLRTLAEGNRDGHLLSSEYGCRYMLELGEPCSNYQTQASDEEIVNQRAAAGLGLTFPARVLVRADEVIE